MLANLWWLIRRAATQWWNDRASRLGAALAYFGAFSIAPATALVVAIASIWFGEDAARGEIARQLTSFLGKHGSEAVQEMLAAAHVSSQNFFATGMSVLLLLAGSFGLLSELQDSLDTIWRAPPRKYASFVAMLLDKLRIYLVLLAVLGVFSAVMVANSVVAWLIQFAPKWSLVSLLHAINLVTVWAAATVLIGIIYRVLPNVRMPWRDLWLGAAITAVLFLIGKTLIGRYLAVSELATVHGAAGSFVAFLVWLYYTAQVFLFGAELTEACAELNQRDGKSKN